jgi:hypothetical protein
VPQALTRVREPPLFPEITHVKKRAFLMGFVQTGSRVKAARLAQMDDRMHWHWLKTDPIYTAAFGRAEQMAGDRVEDRWYTLSLEGTRKGVYHVDTTHSVSPVMQALMKQWQALRDQPAQPRSALASGDADYTEAEVVSLPDIQKPDQTSTDAIFRMLDRLNQHDIGGDDDD